MPNLPDVDPPSPPVEEPTVPVTLTIAGTLSSGFRFRNGRLEQHRMDFKQPLTHAQAKRLAEFVVELVNE